MNEKHWILDWMLCLLFLFLVAVTLSSGGLVLLILLLVYISCLFGEGGEEKVTVYLVTHLHKIPWLLVLDGLSEHMVHSFIMVRLARGVEHGGTHSFVLVLGWGW